MAGNARAYASGELYQSAIHGRGGFDTVAPMLSHQGSSSGAAKLPRGLYKRESVLAAPVTRRYSAEALEKNIDAQLARKSVANDRERREQLQEARQHATHERQAAVADADRALGEAGREPIGFAEQARRKLSVPNRDRGVGSIARAFSSGWNAMVDTVSGAGGRRLNDDDDDDDESRGIHHGAGSVQVRRFDRMLARFCYMIVWVRVVRGFTRGSRL